MKLPVVAFLGLGAMGARMAARVLAAGYETWVYNRTPARCLELVERGARAAARPRDAAAGADVVLSMVSDDEASRAVWLSPDGARASLRPGAIAIECSTLTPGWIAELGAQLHAAGVRLLDAPVGGSRMAAEAGSFPFFVGGEAETLAEVRELLLSMSGAILHIGPRGAGAQMKLAANALLGIQIAALGECLATLERAGIARAEALEVIASLPLSSPALRRSCEWIAAGDRAPRFPITLVAKDLRYALASAAELDVEASLTAAAHAAFARAEALGLGDRNINAVVDIHARTRSDEGTPHVR